MRKLYALAAILTIIAVTSPAIAAITVTPYAPTYANASLYNHTMFYGNGTISWTVPKNVGPSMDFWLCGAGGAGSGGGGGSGYCQLYPDVPVTTGSVFNITPGFGGQFALDYTTNGMRGNTTYVVNLTYESSMNFTAHGGYGGQKVSAGFYRGGDGGAGGGGYANYTAANYGGTLWYDGGNGHAGTGGTGSGNITQQEFGEPDGKSFNGGGAGGGGDSTSPGGFGYLFGGGGQGHLGVGDAFPGGIASGGGGTGTPSRTTGKGGDGLVIIRYTPTGALPSTEWQRGNISVDVLGTTSTNIYVAGKQNYTISAFNFRPPIRQLNIWLTYNQSNTIITAANINSTRLDEGWNMTNFTHNVASGYISADFNKVTNISSNPKTGLMDFTVSPKTIGNVSGGDTEVLGLPGMGYNRLWLENASVWDIGNRTYGTYTPIDGNLGSHTGIISPGEGIVGQDTLRQITVGNGFNSNTTAARIVMYYNKSMFHIESVSLNASAPLGWVSNVTSPEEGIYVMNLSSSPPYTIPTTNTVWDFVMNTTGRNPSPSDIIIEGTYLTGIMWGTIPLNTSSSESIIEEQYTKTLSFKNTNTRALIVDQKVTIIINGSENLLAETYTGQYDLIGYYQSVNIDASASSYFNGTKTIILSDNTPEDIFLLPSEGPVRQQTWYTIQQMEITVVDRNGNTIVGAPINASLNETSWPLGTDWIQTVYGINTVASAEILNKTLAMQGSTDASGGVVFTMISSLGYDVEVIDPETGLAYVQKVFPRGPEYLLYLPIGTNPFATNNTYSQIEDTKLTYAQNESKDHILGIYYHDRSEATNELQFWIKHGNGTIVYSQNFTPVGERIIVWNYTVPNIRGDEYQWFYDAGRT